MESRASARRCPPDVTPAPASTFVIFGASGDLTRRLLLPALYNLAHEQLLDPDFMIVGVDRVERSDEEFRSYIREADALAHARAGR